MGGHQHGGAGPVDPVEQPHDALAGGGVEVAGRLVGQQDQRPVDEGPGDRHPLLLAAGQLVGQVVALLGQADQVEDLGHLGAHHVLGPADHLEGERHVLVDRLVGQQPEVLEDAADVAAQVGHPPLGQGDDVLPGLPDLARGRAAPPQHSRMKSVLPEPEGPTRKTNSPFSMSTVTSRRATVVPLYDLVTCSNLIIRMWRWNATRQRGDAAGRWQPARARLPASAPHAGIGHAQVSGHPSGGRDGPGASSAADLTLAAQLGLHERVEVPVEHRLDVARLVLRCAGP